MKALVIFGALLFSLTTFANTCPDLTGTYQCTYQDENGNEQTSVVKVTQSTTNGITTYESVSENEVLTITADNQVRETVEDGGGYFIRQSIRATCGNNVLHVSNIFAGAFDPNFTQLFVEGNADTQFTANAQILTMATTGSQWYLDENGNKKTENFSDMNECTRL